MARGIACGSRTVFIGIRSHRELLYHFCAVLSAILPQQRGRDTGPLTLVLLRRSPSLGVGLAAHRVVVVALIYAHWRTDAGCHTLRCPACSGWRLALGRHVGCSPSSVMAPSAQIQERMVLEDRVCTGVLCWRGYESECTGACGQGGVLQTSRPRRCGCKHVRAVRDIGKFPDHAAASETQNLMLLH